MSVIELQQQPSLLVITSPVEKVIGGASALPPIGPAGGDLAGTYPNPTIRDGAVVLADIADGSVTDAKVAAGAAIAYSKLNLAASIVNADIAAGAAIARSKLDFGAGLVNADIAAGAAIAASKLGPLSPLTLSSTAIGQTPLTVRGFAGQTADLQQWQTSAPTTVASIGSAGAALFAALQVTGGNYRVDSSGRASMGSGNAPLADRFLDIGGTTNHPGTGTTVRGVVVNYKAPSTATLFSQAFYAQNTSAAAAYTLGTAAAYFVDTPSPGAGSTIGTAAGVYVQNQGTGQVQQAIGIYVGTQSGSALGFAARFDGGSTANLWLNSDTASAAGGVAFGSSRDVSVFRAAGSTLGLNGNVTVDTSGRIGLRTAIGSDRLMWVGGTHPGSGSTSYGIDIEPTFPSTATANGRAVYAQIRTVAAAFTMGTGTAFFADIPSVGSGSTITSALGMRVSNQGNGSITNAYGALIDAQSGAVGGVNIGVRIDTSTTAALWLGGDAAGTTVSGGIAFGSGRDVTIFRSAANTLTIGATAGLITSNVKAFSGQSYQVHINNIGALPAILFGSGEDVNIYRELANVLRTDNIMRAAQFRLGGGDAAMLTPEQSGGILTLTKATGLPGSPGAGVGKIYLRDGTNVNTLKLVVRAGAAGAETTILDNIPT